MTHLWFAQDVGKVLTWGGMLYASRPGRVWAVYLWEPVHPDDLAHESEQVLAHYGSTAGGIGNLLLGNGVQLSPTLEHWATQRNIPAGDLGEWIPCLITVAHACQLALFHDFNDIRVYATTWGGQHLTVLSPASEAAPALVYRSDLTVTSAN